MPSILKFCSAKTVKPTYKEPNFRTSYNARLSTGVFYDRSTTWEPYILVCFSTYFYWFSKAILSFKTQTKLRRFCLFSNIFESNLLLRNWDCKRHWLIAFSVCVTPLWRTSAISNMIKNWRKTNPRKFPASYPGTFLIKTPYLQIYTGKEWKWNS